jgi:hypothetical protein
MNGDSGHLRVRRGDSNETPPNYISKLNGGVHMALTAKQRSLMEELDTVLSSLELDYWNAERWPSKWKTSRLETTLRWVVRGEVVHQYTLVDELLACRICRYFFGKRSFPKLWRTEKFKLFNYHVIEELSLMSKLRFVKAISEFPKAIAADIERLNSVRNALAHSFFPENLKRQKPMWKGKDIFTSAGLAVFSDDIGKIHEHFKDVFQEARSSVEDTY